MASTLVGIWGLAVTYRSTRAKLEEYRIGIKFACLQFVLIFMNVQFAIIGLLARNDIPACEGTRDSRVRGYRNYYFISLCYKLTCSYFVFNIFYAFSNNLILTDISAKIR